MVGNGSVDLWLQADTDDVDVQVTLTEVRPDGNETLVQSGWQRASQRALIGERLLRPLHTNTEGRHAIAGGEWSEVRSSSSRSATRPRRFTDPRGRRHARCEPAPMEVRRTRRTGGHQGARRARW